MSRSSRMSSIASEGSQMSLIDDTLEVTKYLELARDKEWISVDAMHCRVTACNKLFSTLEDQERRAEYILDNLDAIVERYREKHKSIRPNTLKVYKSRLKSSLEEYLGWSQNPIHWDGGRRFSELKKSKPTRRMVKAAREGRKKIVRGEEPKTDPATASRRLSFPIRPGFDIELAIPSEGITSNELMRLVLFLSPYCRDYESSSVPHTFLI